MADDRSGWIVFDCPACGRPVKMPEAARGTRKACPVCGELISPGHVDDEVPAQFSRALPAERRLAPPPSLRRDARDNWQPAHPEKKAPLFGLAVPRIGEEVALTTEQEMAAREERRARIRRRATEAAAPSWESDETSPKPRKRRRHRRRVGLIWGAAVALFLGAAMAAGVLFGRREAPARAAQRTPAAPEVSAGDLAGGSGASISTISEDEYAELVRVVRSFVAATSVEEALTLVREPERVGRVLSEYWRDHPAPPTRVVSMSPRIELVNYNGLFCGSADLGDYSTRIFAMEKTPGGSFLVDWESYVGWCEIPWELLPRERPTRPVLLRAQVRSDDYFNHYFSDSKKYACFRLNSLDQANRLYGYVPIADPLFAVLASKTKFNPIVLGVLRIRYPDGDTPGNQVEITEWVCDGWVVRGADPTKE